MRTKKRPQYNQELVKETNKRLEVVNYHRLKMVVCHKSIKILTIGWLTAPCHLGTKNCSKVGVLHDVQY